ncbi:hypothetical protein [Paraburkholderia caffeinilytica]|uniref:hypothetical protein n=1 Tax=Paraburkholderia caffeinilytica TaxID=1761016 RepID=UPI0038BDA437
MKPRFRAMPTAFRRARDSSPAWVAVVVGPWLALAALRPGEIELPWLAPCLAIAGWMVLRRLLSTDPEADVSRNMVLLGTLGMLAGLALDVRGAGLALITSQCGSGGMPGVLQVAYLHWNGLPAMHIGMLSAGVSAVSLRGLTGPGTRPSLGVDVLRHAACSAWMLAGMTVGSMLCERGAMGLIGTPASGQRAIVMLGGMFAGMVWGMAAHTAFNRAGKRLRGISLLAA